jgi:hypothetical protein
LVIVLPHANGSSSSSPAAAPPPLPPKELACSYCGRKGRSGSDDVPPATSGKGKGKGKGGGGKSKNRNKKECTDAVVELKMCGGCKAAFYCGVQCQALHWPVHSRQCHL